MKRECYKYFDFAKRFDTVILSENTKVVCEDIPVGDKTKSTDSLLKLVYAKDNRTNLPSGDLQYFVSDKANPKVKQFILDNLMMDVSFAKTPTNSDLSDDDLLLFSRQKDESLEQYMNRLNTSVDQAKWLNAQVKKSQDVPKTEQPSVSSE